jgi:hypothetical protein
MNTQDERKAFDDWHFLDWKLNCTVLDTVEEARIIYDRIYKRSNPNGRFEREQSFKAWQAAKAHEAKKLEGCVVVPVEPTDAIIEAMDQFDSKHDYADMYSAYKSALEAARGGK